jgi:hypothetical protein
MSQYGNVSYGDSGWSQPPHGAPEVPAFLSRQPPRSEGESLLRRIFSRELQPQQCRQESRVSERRQ